MANMNSDEKTTNFDGLQSIKSRLPSIAPHPDFRSRNETHSIKINCELSRFKNLKFVKWDSLFIEANNLKW